METACFQQQREEETKARRQVCAAEKAAETDKDKDTVTADLMHVNSSMLMLSHWQIWHRVLLTHYITGRRWARQKEQKAPFGHGLGKTMFKMV